MGGWLSLLNFEIAVGRIDGTIPDTVGKDFLIRIPYPIATGIADQPWGDVGGEPGWCHGSIINRIPQIPSLNLELTQDVIFLRNRWN